MNEDEEVARNAIRLPKKATRIKNKEPAALQITAEQLLREAKERELVLPAPPKHRISDPEELAEYQRSKRKDFEDSIRKNKHTIANWVKYGKWEESVGEIQRARSVFERALDVDHRSITIWLQYAEMEMRNKQINHARNIFDRAVTILPRSTQFWLKYAYMEEVIENVPGARQVFERWMEWEPSEQAWQTYINFELRYKEVDRARKVYQRMLHIHGTDPKHWIKYAKFEERHAEIDNARAVFETGMEYFGEDNISEVLLLAFAQFEERQKEHERARMIYKYGLDRLPESRVQELFKHCTIHEKKYGERASIEEIIVTKRRLQYENAVAANPFDYDTWFDYTKMLENEDAPRHEVSEIYERAVANFPPDEKRFWRRYIYLWINYAVYEEMKSKDYVKTREIYEACLDVIPHKLFTFAKVWILYAQFEIRMNNLPSARKILGISIGKCPKDKLFRAYIDLELQLREFDRCRILYQKFLETSPENSQTWIKFAEMETLLGEEDRARTIFEIAIKQPALDMPEILWKSYIDFEIQCEQYDKARDLYETLVNKTNHIKVWISYAEFEVSINNIAGARGVYERANKALAENSSEERMMLLDAWLEFEKQHGNENEIKRVENLMPKKIKRRRPIRTADGIDAGWEEYFDYIFPADQNAKGANKLLSAALRWKMEMQKNAEEKEKDEEAHVVPQMDEDDERIGDSDTDIDDDGPESESSSIAPSSSDSG